ncbi:MAG TPA: TonB-dependent receptor [Flavipsychrobacter sp.]|nr:TonB-dependent receptor [Flavipsychrobacter sp.]
MYPKRFLNFLMLFLIPHFVTAQTFTISGNIKDASNGEDLIGAIVTVKGQPNKGSSANTYGFYSLTLPAGDYTLIYQYVGYTSKEESISLQRSQTLNVGLAPTSRNLDEVVVRTERADKNVSSMQMSVFKLDPKQIESVPVLFGEKDIIKTLQLTPGVKAAGEGNAGFYVRGGAADQNLILLDEAPVYNASHMLGFFSVFNSDALKDVSLYKGAIPAEFGGRGSSVMDVKMRDGNNKNFGASGGIGLIASRLTLEGPIVKDKGSFIISGRRTYADLFLKLSSEDRLKNSKLYFYDLNVKANYQLGKRDRIFISGYFGRDVFGFSDVFGFDWGNATATIRWNHIISNKIFSNTALIFSNYNYRIKLQFDGEDITIKSAIQDWNLKQDFNYTLNTNNNIKFGFNIIHHTFKPGSITVGGNSNFNNQQLTGRKALEGALYVQNDMRITDKLGVQYGLRYSGFNFMGDATAYEFDKDGIKTSQRKYKEWESIAYYGGFEPRIAAKYELAATSSIKASYNRNYQYMHLLSNSTTSAPTDLWVPSSNNVKPQIVDQYSVGYFRNFKDNMFELSLEAYYKTLQNQIDYRNGADLIFNEEIEGELVYGKGKAYGFEVLVRKQTGRLTGWVSYTLSRSLRQFDEINNGSEYPARQDRIHDLAIVAMYDLTKKLKISGNWIYYTGSATTFPSGKYVVNGMQVPYYTERNGYRMPDYHRLDLGLTWVTRKTERTERSWNFSLYNAYGRQNAYTISFRQNEDNPQQTEAVQVALFTWVPSITYNFKF